MIVVMSERLAALLEYRKRRRRIIAALKGEAPKVRPAASIPERENRPAWHAERFSNHCNSFGSGPAKLRACVSPVNPRRTRSDAGGDGHGCLC
jgi:hypothetical protein